MQDKKGLRWLFLALFTLCLTAGSWGLNSIPSLGPIIKETMNLSTIQVGALMASFYIGTTMMSFSYSLYFNKFAVKTALLAGLCLIGGFVLVAGLNLQFVWMLFFLVIAGSGYGMINPAINKGIVSWFPQRLRGTVMSLKQIGVMLGSGLGAAVLPKLTISTSISFALAITGISTILVGMVSYFLYKEKSIPSTNKSSDIQESGIKIILADRNLFNCNLAAMLFVGAQFTFFMYLSLYMRDEFHYDIVHTGMILSLATLGGAAGRVGWGLMSDFLFRGERKNVLIFIGMSSTVLGLILAWMPTDIPDYQLYTLVILYGTVIAGGNGLIQAMAVDLAEPRLSGIISGITLSFVYFGTLLLPLLFGISVEGTDNYRLAWTLLSATILVGTVLLFKVKRSGKIWSTELK